MSTASKSKTPPRTPQSTVESRVSPSHLREMPASNFIQTRHARLSHLLGLHSGRRTNQTERFLLDDLRVKLPYHTSVCYGSWSPGLFACPSLHFSRIMSEAFKHMWSFQSSRTPFQLTNRFGHCFFNSIIISRSLFSLCQS